MATFTATPQCYLMDSSSAGASICVLILAGWSCGTEGEVFNGFSDCSLCINLVVVHFIGLYIRQQN